MSQPGSSSVHVPGTEWGCRPKKPKKPPEGETIIKRQLEPFEGAYSRSPFSYEGNILGTLREDQVPRFFATLTDPDRLPTRTVKLDELTAMQNRVDTAKVESFARSMDGGHGSDGEGHLPVVVKLNGRLFIADGHHRLTAEWLKGQDEAAVHFKDLEPESNVMKEYGEFRVAKVDEGLGLVFGFAIVCKVKGEDYYDLNIDPSGERVPEHIPESAMTKAALDLSENGAPGNEMHRGPDSGHYPFLFPLTTDIAKALGITTEKTGLLCAYKPTPEVLAKFKSGEYTGFSIEGARVKSELVE